MAVGPVVKDVSHNFDRYWASESSYPVLRLLPPADPVRIQELASAASLIERDPAAAAAAAYMDALRNSPFVRELIEGRLALEWARTRMVSDDPAKGLGLAAPEALLPQKLKEIIGEPAAEMVLVSPYFVPGAGGADAFAALTERGVEVTVLTNSLEATDVAPVHAGYARRRKSLIEAGITLYELRRLSPDTGANKSAGLVGSSGSSASGLHAKTFSVDRSCVFIGSFNFDPRSAKLNTEMGFIIDSPALAQSIAAAFDSGIPANAYEVRLSDTGELFWIERRGEKLVRHDTEPGTNFWQRAGVWFLSLFPIEWLL
jgi:putative cardiolipin synthase